MGRIPASPLALLFLIITTKANTFNVTRLKVPKMVSADTAEVDIECDYDANFTILYWFKGSNEFFRYEPKSIPSTHAVALNGVGKLDVVSCGRSTCHLRLGMLTEEASGLYRCDVERALPPYKYATMSSHMEVLPRGSKPPVVEGLAVEYGEGDEMQVRCRAAPNVEVRWYINGREIEIRDATLKRKVTKHDAYGQPPTIAVQCAEYKAGVFTGSKAYFAQWKVNAPLEQRNSSSKIECLGLMSVFCVLFKYVLLS